ncbi:hypothetical protein Slin15195_G046050 [Septoria linicola]|uniref:Uncharacterized protein n=1 Tax=Septoria linicola TaxID=215465 RepID=A0A9Q9EGZ5_9PEZI|nr:hypothetical protein Slin14017_G049580 [Septoria linicola]USW51286.1 hypothetical protein Slin15195_G046050 [Septoria linicola]
MAEISDSAPGAEQGRYQQITPSQGQKRNNRNRKNYQQNQFDGAMSDGAIMNPATSPRPRKQNQRQSVATAPGQQQHDNMGQGNAPRARPISYAGGRVPATPAKEQAYAGPTFQASPAASALPMPKFSKSVPNAAMRGSLSARLAAEKKSDGEQSSPETDAPAPVPPPRETMNSPLDLFFQADREEKARSASQTLSPQAAYRPQPPATEPRNPFAQTGRSIFLNELNGDSDLPSPRTVPHTDQRPHMGHRAVSSPGVPQRNMNTTDAGRRTETQNLKDMLFSAAARPSNQPNNQSRTPSGSSSPNGNFHSPSPFNRPVSGSGARPHSGPSTPQPTYEQQQHDNYSLHYGNRNLSPLFKASRSETPQRPSSLRQEVASDTSSNADSGVAVGDPYSPNTFARNYLNQTAHTSGPVEMPHLAFNHHPSNFQGYPAGPPPSVNAQQGHPQQGASMTSSAPHGNESRDMSAESAELRRMLKIF